MTYNVLMGMLNRTHSLNFLFIFLHIAYVTYGSGMLFTDKRKVQLLWQCWVCPRTDLPARRRNRKTGTHQKTSATPCTTMNLNCSWAHFSTNTIKQQQL